MCLLRKVVNKSLLCFALLCFALPYFALPCLALLPCLDSPGRICMNNLESKWKNFHDHVGHNKTTWGTALVKRPRMLGSHWQCWSQSQANRMHNPRFCWKMQRSKSIKSLLFLFVCLFVFCHFALLAGAFVWSLLRAQVEYGAFQHKATEKNVYRLVTGVEENVSSFLCNNEISTYKPNGVIYCNYWYLTITIPINMQINLFKQSLASFLK